MNGREEQAKGMINCKPRASGQIGKASLDTKKLYNFGHVTLKYLTPRFFFCNLGIII